MVVDRLFPHRYLSTYQLKNALAMKPSSFLFPYSSLLAPCNTHKHTTHTPLLHLCSFFAAQVQSLRYVVLDEVHCMNGAWCCCAL